MLLMDDEQPVALPLGAQILSVANQNDKLVLYALVDAEQTITKDIDIYIHGTGHKVNEKADLFLGTVLLYGGAMVVHVFGDSKQFVERLWKVI